MPDLALLENNSALLENNPALLLINPALLLINPALLLINPALLRFPHIWYEEEIKQLLNAIIPNWRH